MLSVMRLILGPALLWQGARVRKNILRMPEASGMRSGSSGQGQSLRVLILGDSSAAGVGAKTQDDALSGQLVPRLAQRFSVTWHVHAMTGWTTEDALTALDALDGQSFDLAIISLGVNDVTTETGLSKWLATYTALVDKLDADHGVTKFVLSGMPPMGRFPALPQPLRWYLGQQAMTHDRALGRLAEKRSGTVHAPLDFGDMDESAVAEDGFHPGPPIYASWARQVDKVIQDLIG